MSDRDRVRLTTTEVTGLLVAGRKVQFATINPDGTPHLVTMFYALREGRIAFWTYRASQKARNLARDPRLTCLVEDGEDYFELRGVQVNGVAEPIEDPAEVAGIGRLVAARLTGVPTTAVTTVDGPVAAADGTVATVDERVAIVDEYVARAARKRVAYLVQPQRITSWDHRRLLT